MSAIHAAAGDDAAILSLFHEWIEAQRTAGKISEAIESEPEFALAMDRVWETSPPPLRKERLASRSRFTLPCTSSSPRALAPIRQASPALIPRYGVMTLRGI
jgi:hypothetical protein